jgi:hypothetical protein
MAFVSVKRGMTRIVFLVGAYAVKLPNIFNGCVLKIQSKINRRVSVI